jgi:N-dimethylarginine dimethylaminohydrolase
MRSRSFSTALPHAFVRRPPKGFAAGLVTHIGAPVDTCHDRAMVQWSGYVDALRRNEFKITELPLIDSPDSAFVEDPAIVFKTKDGNGSIAVVCRQMGAPERRDEVPTMEDVLTREIGGLFDRVECIEGGNRRLDGE